MSMALFNAVLLSMSLSFLLSCEKVGLVAQNAPGPQEDFWAVPNHQGTTELSKTQLEEYSVVIGEVRRFLSALQVYDAPIVQEWEYFPAPQENFLATIEKNCKFQYKNETSSGGKGLHRWAENKHIDGSGDCPVLFELRSFTGQSTTPIIFPGGGSRSDEPLDLGYTSIFSLSLTGEVKPEFRPNNDNKIQKIVLTFNKQEYKRQTFEKFPGRRITKENISGFIRHQSYGEGNVDIPVTIFTRTDFTDSRLSGGVISTGRELSGVQIELPSIGRILITEDRTCDVRGRCNQTKTQNGKVVQTF